MPSMPPSPGVLFFGRPNCLVKIVKIFALPVRIYGIISIQSLIEPDINIDERSESC
jgi:hypothetical protein